MSEQVPGQPDPSVIADQAPTVQQPAFQPAAVAYPAAPVAEPAKPGVHVPKWVAAVAAVVIVGLGGFAIGKATSDDDSNAQPAGFSQQGGRQGGSTDGQQPGGQSGGFGPQSGNSQQGGNTDGQQPGGFGQQGGSSSSGSNQQGGQNGPMTRSGGS